MISVIAEESRTYEYSLASSPYEAFAGIILDGYSSWEIKTPTVGTDTSADSDSEDGKRVKTWIAVSDWKKAIITLAKGQSIDYYSGTAQKSEG